MVKFGPEYINRLHAMIARNITPPFRLFCFTDDGTGCIRMSLCARCPISAYQVFRSTPRGKWPAVAAVGIWRDVTGVVLFLTGRDRHRQP